MLYAWGHDELLPLSRTYVDSYEMGLTIIDSLDTLWIMGYFDDLFELATFHYELLKKTLLCCVHLQNDGRVRESTRLGRIQPQLTQISESLSILYCKKNNTLSFYHMPCLSFLPVNHDLGV